MVKPLVVAGSMLTAVLLLVGLNAAVTKDSRTLHSAQTTCAATSQTSRVGKVSCTTRRFATKIYPHVSTFGIPSPHQSKVPPTSDLPAQ